MTKANYNHLITASATKEAAHWEDVCDEISNVVKQIRIVACRLNEMEQNCKISQFFDCKPPSLGQDTDPLFVTNWIFKLESIFKLIGCSDEQKVSFAVLRLKDAAFSWWILAKRGLEADGIRVTWLKFKKLVSERYFPAWMQHEKYLELCKLVQGDRTVDEYELEFMQLSSLVYKKYIRDDAWQVTLLERGFRPEIRTRLRFLNDMSYNEVRRAALMVEQRLNTQEDED